jgi:hypothetical protein
MISILLVASLAACIIFVVANTESVDKKCNVNRSYHNSKKGKR